MVHTGRKSILHQLDVWWCAQSERGSVPCCATPCRMVACGVTARCVVASCMSSCQMMWCCETFYMLKSLNQGGGLFLMLQQRLMCRCRVMVICKLIEHLLRGVMSCGVASLCSVMSSSKLVCWVSTCSMSACGMSTGCVLSRRHMVCSMMRSGVVVSTNMMSCSMVFRRRQSLDHRWVHQSNVS